MPRSLRIDVGGEIYHCLNRAVARQQIFNSPDDYHLFLSILEEVYDVAATGKGVRHLCFKISGG